MHEVAINMSTCFELTKLSSLLISTSFFSELYKALLSSLLIRSFNLSHTFLSSILINTLSYHQIGFNSQYTLLHDETHLLAASAYFVVVEMIPSRHLDAVENTVTTTGTKCVIASLNSLNAPSFGHTFIIFLRLRITLNRTLELY